MAYSITREYSQMEGIKMKKIISLLLSVVMVVSMFTAIPFTAGAAWISGKCGDNVSYSYDSATRELVIAGTGKMYRYYYEGAVSFYYICPDVKTITIENGVTSIGTNAFIWCTSLSSVTIPDSVTEIGNCAFQWCSILKSIKLPKHLKTIEYETFDDKEEFPVENFRVSMSAMNHWEDSSDYYTYDYTYTDGNMQATNIKELQQMFKSYGATEMYVRINTTRYYPEETVNDYYHAKMHCLEESKKACRVAVELGMPINVELGCFAGYSDAFESQYPDFSEYPEIDYPTENGKRKEWKDMNIDEICSVLQQYGKLVATEINALGTDVQYWDLGNETNYGFGGIMMPLKSSVSKATSKNFFMTCFDYRLPSLAARLQG